jgi:hypothetical protein
VVPLREAPRAGRRSRPANLVKGHKNMSVTRQGAPDGGRGRERPSGALARWPRGTGLSSLCHRGGNGGAIAFRQLNWPDWRKFHAATTAMEEPTPRGPFRTSPTVFLR